MKKTRNNIVTIITGVTYLNIILLLYRIYKLSIHNSCRGYYLLEIILSCV